MNLVNLTVRGMLDDGKFLLVKWTGFHGAWAWSVETLL